MMANHEFPLLSCGSITNILNQEMVNHAILQVMGYKRVPGTGPTRFRLLLNDGKTLFPFAILSTQLNGMIESKKLEKFTIVKLTKYACTEIQPSKKIIICLEIESLVPGDLINKQISVSHRQDDHSSKLQVNGESYFESTVNSTFNNYLGNKSVNSKHIEADRILNSPLCTRTQSLRNSNFKINHSTVDCKSPYELLTNSNTSSRLLTSKSEENQVLNNTFCKQIECLHNSNPGGNGSSLNIHADCSMNFKSPNQLLSNINLPNIRFTNSPSIDNRGISKSFNSAATVSNSQVSIVPIINLTPYQNKWTIKGRIVYKTSLIHYNNQRYAGKLISFYLLDETGEIRATAFNEQAEQLHSYLDVGKVYYISNASVKLARENTPLKCDFEITVSENTKIELATDESNLPMVKFNFIPISQIRSLPKETYIDVIGICLNISEVRIISCKGSGREVKKRDVLLVDQSKITISLTLWGTDAENFVVNGSPLIIAVRNAKITDFNGCSLSLSTGTMMFVNPEVLQTSQLRSWFQREGDSLEIKNSVCVTDGYTQLWRLLADVASFDLEDSDRTEYFTVKACVTMIQKEKCMYQACPALDCFKKVVDLCNGLYRCVKCDKDYSSFVWILLLSLNISDFSDNLWVVAFRDVAEVIIGRSSDELSRLKTENEDEYYKVLTDVQFRCFIFKLRSKMEVYNDTRQMKTTILDAKPVDSISFTEKLLRDIKRMEKILHPEVA